MRTIDSILAEYRGIGPGFDFLRITLAVTIVLTHAGLLLGHFWISKTPLWFAGYALVPMFFALSGFLVAGSAMRLSLRNFLLNRELRIIPALAVDVVICVLIIGPIVTTVPLTTYFTDSRFFSYFLNVFGWIHYHLPGVFEDHVNTRVNGALWTVPYEIFCYSIMSLLIVSRWIFRPLMVVALTLTLLGAGLLVENISAMLGSSTADVLEFLFTSRGSQLLMAFLFGILMFQLKAYIPYSWTLMAIACAICIIAIFTLGSESRESVANRFILLPALVYITVFIGLTPIPLPKIVHSGDYSYGIYLYHDPLLQIIISVLPLSLLGPKLGWPVLALLGVPAVSLLAAFSWHVIEKPILAMRKKFSFVARVRGVADQADASVAPPLSEVAGETPDNAETISSDAVPLRT